jgi:2'-5' RNA ligase
VARDRAARPEAKPWRLFVAVDLPGPVVEGVGRSLGPVREAVDASAPGAGRWTSPQGWHVTVKFLGSTWPRLVGWVREAVASVAAGHPAFETALEGWGAFPSARRARVLWAGLRDPSPGFATLAAALDGALAPEFEPEKRSHTPHLTVARFRPPADLQAALAAAGSSVLRGEPFAVDRVVLYRSHLGRPAARYEVLDELPLAQGPSGPTR